MLLNESPVISSGSLLSNCRAYEIQWKSNPILPSNVHSNSKLISYEHSQQRNTVLILWTALPQAYLGRIVLQKEPTKSAERGTKTKWGILLRICRHKCQWLSKVGFKKHWSITKFSFIRWRLYELMLMRPSVWLDIFWHKAPTHKVHKLNGGPPVVHKPFNCEVTKVFPAQHSSSRNFVRLASTKIIFSACVR